MATLHASGLPKAHRNMDRAQWIRHLAVFPANSSSTPAITMHSTRRFFSNLFWLPAKSLATTSCTMSCLCSNRPMASLTFSGPAKSTSSKEKSFLERTPSRSRSKIVKSRVPGNAAPGRNPSAFNFRTKAKGRMHCSTLPRSCTSSCSDPSTDPSASSSVSGITSGNLDRGGLGGRTSLSPISCAAFKAASLAAFRTSFCIGSKILSGLSGPSLFSAMRFFSSTLVTAACISSQLRSSGNATRWMKFISCSRLGQTKCSIFEAELATKQLKLSAFSHPKRST
mmetsp:Transcript_47167/g.102745  ORF Transcript_47167/g.102745 Transcript_47167/m.102745 type:complete len:282 (+) Transcript_47167:1003-1848(+)